MIFRTLNSVYEVDLVERAIRRLSGVNDPTPRQGVDGEWRTYWGRSAIEVGRSATIIWRYSKAKSAFETTLTSTVIEVRA